LPGSKRARHADLVIALIIVFLVLAAFIACVVQGRDSRELDDERGWWATYRRDQY